jgi:integrase
MRHLFEIVMEQASPLHKALTLLLFSSGIRNAEARNIKLKDFQTNEGLRVLRYIGKGQKVNEITIHPATAHHIDEYISWMEKKGRKIGPDDFLFQPTKNSHSGKLQKKLSHTALGYVIKKWARKVNPNKRITPHSARSTFITSLLENGEDLYTVAQCVNHSDPRTTARYDRRARNFKRSPVLSLNFF